MIDKDEENHQKADEERDIPCDHSDLEAVFGSDWEGYFSLAERYFMRLIFESIVEIDLFVYLVSVLQQVDEFVSLSLSFDSHHDVVASVA